MAESVSATTGKKLIQIDISSDTVCPWCFVGKRNLDKAIAASKDQYDFEIRWRPFQLEPNGPKEGVDKREFYRKKFGPQSERMAARMTEVFKNLGLEYSLSGLTGNTLDSHRLINFAGQQGSEKQHKLVEELFNGYFTQAKYVGDWEFLVESANKAGIEGAVEFLQDPNNGVKEINNGKQKLSGAQPPEVFLRAFEVATN
ncbi:DSBA-like thioredoxin domain containing protein [Trema orientale]|uniref:DSBA-like thioredoxin domain containing protein n=1 Tax=Trema orientale TaxID=63057 RepID=A0A2P5E969_TREOI|nr:DSBA-like thioredoxin domain containing protein [Trema orientale]